MNKEKAKEMALVMAAWAEGMPIEFKPKYRTAWSNTASSKSSGMGFDFHRYDYRLPPPAPKVWYMPVYKMESGLTRGVPCTEETYERIKNEPNAFGRKFIKLVETE